MWIHWEIVTRSCCQASGTFEAPFDLGWNPTRVVVTVQEAKPASYPSTSIYESPLYSHLESAENARVRHARMAGELPEASSENVQVPQHLQQNDKKQALISHRTRMNDKGNKSIKSRTIIMQQQETAPPTEKKGVSSSCALNNSEIPTWEPHIYLGHLVSGAPEATSAPIESEHLGPISNSAPKIGHRDAKIPKWT